MCRVDGKAAPIVPTGRGGPVLPRRRAVAAGDSHPPVTRVRHEAEQVDSVLGFTGNASTWATATPLLTLAAGTAVFVPGDHPGPP